MRFEIRTGGIAGILVGVFILSGVVFMLGLRAGYDIEHEVRRDTAQVTENYSLPPPPAEAQASAPSPAPAIAHAATTPVSTRLASATKPPPAAEPDTADEPADNDEPIAPKPVAPPSAKRVASAETVAPSHDARRKPFNIQIEAAMDEASAQDMVKRLGALGYQPHLLPTEINGATWYKVEIGPYTTQEAATAAEADLRRKYNATYGRGSAPAQPDDTDQGPE